MVEKYQYPEIVNRALQTLSDPDKWTIGRRNDGLGKHCVIGHLELALVEFGMRLYDRQLEDTMNEIASLMGFGQDQDQDQDQGQYKNRDALCAMAAHNNTHKHEEVVQRFAAGIETLKQNLAAA